MKIGQFFDIHSNQEHIFLKFLKFLTNISEFLDSRKRLSHGWTFFVHLNCRCYLTSHFKRYSSFWHFSTILVSFWALTGGSQACWYRSNKPSPSSIGSLFEELFKFLKFYFWNFNEFSGSHRGLSHGWNFWSI